MFASLNCGCGGRYAIVFAAVKLAGDALTAFLKLPPTRVFRGFPSKNRNCPKGQFRDVKTPLHSGAAKSGHCAQGYLSPGLKSDILRDNSLPQRVATYHINAYLHIMLGYDTTTALEMQGFFSNFFNFFAAGFILCPGNYGNHYMWVFLQKSPKNFLQNFCRFYALYYKCKRTGVKSPSFCRIAKNNSRAFSARLSVDIRIFGATHNVVHAYFIKIGQLDQAFGGRRALSVFEFGKQRLLNPGFHLNGNLRVPPAFS